MKNEQESRRVFKFKKSEHETFFSREKLRRDGNLEFLEIWLFNLFRKKHKISQGNSL